MGVIFRAARRRPTGVLGIGATLLLTGAAAAEPTVWSGPTIAFAKPPFASPPPADQLTANVALTRGDARGLYNAAQESFFMTGVSPVDTAWATSLNNPGETISAANWAALSFTTWENAYGGAGSLAFQITQQKAVVHLVSDDIYLDLQFTDWGVGLTGGGSFSYERSTPPAAPPPTGDYNGDGFVDAADYVVWRKTLNQPAVPQGSGADGNANGMIDDGDFSYWRVRFGNTVPGSGAAAVPEPAGAVLLWFACISCARLRRGRRAV